ncbi:MAG: 50S ribosomal protein L35 [Oscillatoriales cyanobacterium RM1_1_9]|nr:50S ribosomal protein L35 [Oscillatoriales cyanobacterium SM2_3_0]NJO44608.1 50S ribosomal protein L35 [Oscillatoriales cyanobacterium RM2_1_1]NJO71011.1 50S ribosomal protein L35 [Oscillatoriales cyanobacterium RM1_1_9]
MPKLKTRKSAARRFKVTGSGKIVRRKAFKSHLLQHKSSSRKARLSRVQEIHETNYENVKLMLPYI